jgi:hypothetical protein
MFPSYDKSRIFLNVRANNFLKNIGPSNGNKLFRAILFKRFQTTKMVQCLNDSPRVQISGQTNESQNSHACSGNQSLTIPRLRFPRNHFPDMLHYCYFCENLLKSNNIGEASRCKRYTTGSAQS